MILNHYQWHFINAYFNGGSSAYYCFSVSVVSGNFFQSYIKVCKVEFRQARTVITAL